MGVLVRLLPLFVCSFFLHSQTLTEVVLEDFTDMITAADQQVNDFAGNIGLVNKNDVPYGHTSVVSDGRSSQMLFAWDFTLQPDPNPFAGVFFSLFGRTGMPEYSLDLDRVDGALREPGGDRSYASLRVRVRNNASSDVWLRLELTDTIGGGRVSSFRLASGNALRTITWNFRDPARFDVLGKDLDIHKAKLLTLLVQRQNVLTAVRNPDRGSLLIDSIVFVPDRPEIEPADSDDLLDLLERRTMQYFLDWSSRNPSSLGIPQDRSTFPDVLTTGGIGFALPAYAIAAERGYIDRADAANRTVSVLRILADRSAFCPQPSGCIGYRGWLYHFLGTDGRRKQTGEVSSIDTALALMGVLVAQSYFTGEGGVEAEIRTLAQEIYDAVDWPFMVEEESRQLYLGWKPVEQRDGRAFEVPDADGLGHYSGTSGEPDTLDFYTDEAFLLTLLALGSNTNVVNADVHCAWNREADGTGLIRSWSGSLFTFFAARAFVDTAAMELRPCPEERPVDWLANSRGAFFRVLDHVRRNPAGLPTYRADAWGISAAENPLDQYRAFGAQPVAVNDIPLEDGTVTYYGAVGTTSAGDDLRTQALGVLRRAWDRRHWHHRFALPDAIHDNMVGLYPEPAQIQVEGESGKGPGVVRERPGASGGRTLRLRAGDYGDLAFEVEAPAVYSVSLRASNAGTGDLETVDVLVDGVRFAMVTPANTGDENTLVTTAAIATVGLWSGSHSITLRVSGGDGVAPEVDWVRLDPQQPAGVNKAWVNRTLFAVDQGFMLLHLENERSGLIWRLLGENANIQRALDRLRPIATVSAARLEAGHSMTPDSIASTFGQGLATRLEAAPSAELPTELAGTTATLLDGANTLHQSRFYFVAPGQSNWWIPPEAAIGQATLTIISGDGTVNAGTLEIERIAPSLFSADASGSGAPAAILIRVASDGTQSSEIIGVGSQIAFGPPEEQLFLVLFGTGIRHRPTLRSVELRIGGIAVPVSFGGAQAEFPGFDQVNAGPLSRDLVGAGSVNLVLRVSGRTANILNLTFR